MGRCARFWQCLPYIQLQKNKVFEEMAGLKLSQFIGKAFFKCLLSLLNSMKALAVKTRNKSNKTLFAWYSFYKTKRCLDKQLLHRLSVLSVWKIGKFKSIRSILQFNFDYFFATTCFIFNLVSEFVLPRLPFVSHGLEMFL